ncbi:MAG: D-2-hydroxyacid dehydrogenase [Alphaproteobacteria bacterium]|nr:D-2-hydroxyacid dehydrogenase [Alphaproteobacteria bacterium SS10]
MTRPILVAHTDPSEVSSVLSERFPDQAFEYVTHGSMVADALAAHEPEVIFAVAGPSFRRDVHEVMLNHPSVKWLQVGGSGYDHLPFEWDRERVAVTHCAGVLSQYLAETVTGAMLALNGHFLRYRALQSIAEWRPIPFRPIAGQTLLVVGFGAIGQRLAHNARALGMNVIATRNTPAEHPLADEVHGPDRETLLSLLPKADVVSLHLRLNHDTKRSFDAECFAAMKQGAMFINTARGRVVDSDALLAALNDGKLMGAYLDVFEKEPLPPEHPLWQAPNTLITPHTADNVLKFPAYYAEFFADNLARFKAGSELKNRIK